jgi:hypothetical protein
MTPFEIAERYIQLRRKCAPTSWVETIMRINEMILTPLITIFLFLVGRTDTLSMVATSLSVFRAWREWIEFTRLRFEVQTMFLQTMTTGGPRIVTNDPEYMPYVFADAVTRIYGRHRVPEEGRQP